MLDTKCCIDFDIWKDFSVGRCHFITKYKTDSYLAVSFAFSHLLAQVLMPIPEKSMPTATFLYCFNA